MRIHLIESIDDPLANCLNDDPVRPHIPPDTRIGSDRAVLVLLDELSVPHAVVCIAYQCEVPANESELFVSCPCPTTAVCYTIWSYRRLRGCGAHLLHKAIPYIQTAVPTITRIVTLSPLDDHVRQFHLGNGASVYRINANSVNYRYA